jgi:CubicO group peptidase (beta-lactamase class C family)
MVALDEASAAAILVRQKGKTVFEWYFGKHNWSPDARPVDADSRFPIWSLTKAYVATALGLALDAGKVKLDDPVCLYVPEYTGKGKEKVTLRHLATHTAGLTGLGEWREAELVKQPGEVPQYSNIGMDLLAHAVGKAMGDGGFGQTLQKRLFEPLGLSHSGFLCPGDDTTLLVPAVKTRKDEPWYDPWGPEGRGMAGLYVSARDLAAFGELYLNGGELNGKRILAASTVRLLTSPRQAPGSLADKVPYQALAWRIQGNWPLSEQDVSAPAGTISHTGGTHCYIMVCPALELVAVKLLNRGYWPGTFDFDGDFRRFCKLVVEAAVGEP